MLAQNRSCKINFESQEYKNLPDSCTLLFYIGIDLMIKLLEKDPKKRIDATSALNHDFFSKDELFKEFVEQRRNSTMSGECDSP